MDDTLQGTPVASQITDDMDSCSSESASEMREVERWTDDAPAAVEPTEAANASAESASSENTEPERTPQLTLVAHDDEIESGPDVPTVDRAFEDAARVIEALLFSSDAPLSASRLAEIAAITPNAVRLHVAWLNDRYTAARMSFRIEEIARGYQMLTLAEFQPALRRLHAAHAETRLSAAAMEALSIIAYKQPIIRADIEAIRGVACGEVLNRLREAGLIRTVGRAEVVGRPMLYGTTRKFLDLFGLADLNDLPPLEALKLRPAPQTPPAVEPPPAPRAAAGA